MRRRAVVGGAVLAALWMAPGTALAHGIGGRLDLPVPVSYFVAAAGSVVVVSFVALAMLWPTPRFDSGPLERKLLSIPTWISWLLGLVGIAGLIVVIGQVVPSILGLDTVRGRPSMAPVLVWVMMWLVVPFLSALIGNWYRSLNPWNSLGLVFGVGRTERTDVFARVGVWPAAVVLVAFAWLELISPQSANPAALGWAAVAYTTYLLLAMGFMGRLAATASGDLFTVYNRLFSAVSPFGRSVDGQLVWRGWLRALPALPEWPGLAFFVVAAIGTVTYDGASGAAWFRNATSGLGGSRLGQTALLLGSVLLVALAYWSASWMAARLSPGSDANVVARRFAHTLVPIALAYAVAHYATLIAFEGQQLISAMSDPFALGWDLFGTADRSVNFFLTASEPVWYFQLAVIIIGHVLGVVLAHDRALIDFGKDAVRSQYAMLFLMVGLTSLGLVILAG